MPDSKLPRALGVGCVLLLLCACGGDEGEDRPAPGTPAWTLEALTAAAAEDDVAAFMAHVLPEQRPLLTFGLALLPAMTLHQIAEAMRPAAAAAGEDELAKSHTRIQAIREDLEALQARHGIEVDDEMRQRVVMGSKEARAEVLGEILGDVDHAVFIRDARAFLARHSPSHVEGPLLKSFVHTYADVTEEGAVATAAVDGGAGRIRLLKRDGRWYLDLESIP